MAVKGKPGGKAAPGRQTGPKKKGTGNLTLASDSTKKAASSKKPAAKKKTGAEDFYAGGATGDQEPIEDFQKNAGESVEAEAPSGKKPRQPRLPETEDNKIEAIEAEIDELAKHRSARQFHLKKEVESSDRLLEKMHEAGLTKYVRDGYKADVVVEKEKVKVKSPKAGEAEDEE